jgi:imidazolonepropionase-like amidohydrolase
VRDCANDIDQLTRLISNYEAGKMIGPRVVRIGFIDGKGPYAAPTKVLVDNEAEARAAVRKYADLGYDQIKIYSSIKTQLVPVIVEEARAAGLPVSGHIPAFMTAEQAVRLGLNEIHHANFWFLNFLGDTVKDTRSPLRFTAVGEHAALLDLESPQVNSFLALLKERSVVVDPTVNIFESMFVDRKGSPAVGLRSELHRLPPQIRRQAYSGGLPVPEGMDQRYRDSFAAMMKMLKRMYDRGIPIVAGTDGLPGFALHRELELYVQAGIAPAQTLQIATLQAARATKRDRDLGSIASGKLADLILVDGDPVANISDIRRVELIIKDGKLYKSADLYTAIGITP